uniref:DnaJ sub C member 1 n=1 Tax=Sphaerodactylus townsendi TaxID=933632 RepID=A0ACB8FVZ5_9SAUR
MLLCVAACTLISGVMNGWPLGRNAVPGEGIESKDASSADIRKAYRKLSLILHPDKNKDENAETQFRQLVAIYEVLKDEEQRHKYDDILINGLPDWRQPVFYYRRVRKMSNAELALLLFIILTVGHYGVVWSIYLEKQLDELLSRKKRERKKKAGGKNVDEVKLGGNKNERLLDKPQWRDLLPCKLGIWFCLTVKALPQLFQNNYFKPKELFVAAEHHGTLKGAIFALINTEDTDSSTKNSHF